MPVPTRTQLLLLEVAAAAAAIGFAARGAWLIAGIAVAVVFVVLGAAPIRRRWAYQLVLAYVRMLRRRSQVRGPGLQSLLDGYRVVTVPAGRQGTTFGAVGTHTLWTVVLEIAADAVLNDDAGVPVDQLAGLLQVEDVPLASVRLVTLGSPAVRTGDVPPQPVAPPATLAARYCLLTLDVSRASGPIADRGGGDAAVAQILRRCVIRAEEVFAANGLTVRRLDEAAVAALFPTMLGPAAQSPDAMLTASAEGWGRVRVAGTWSVTFGVSGGGEDVLDRFAALVTAVRAPLAVSTLLLTTSRTDGTRCVLLLRLSGPGDTPAPDALGSAEESARLGGLALQRLDGEQGRLLRATTPVGVGP